MEFNFTICCIEDDFAELLNKEFPQNNKYNISVFPDDFRLLNESYDAIVSPGNSYGIMDGGIDMAISRHFGDRDIFINHIQFQLKEKFNLKQTPGTACILNTNSDKCKYLIHVPMMVIAKRITDKSVIYWGFYNLLHEVFKHNKEYDDIKKISMCALSTGTGNIQYIQFIKLIKLAYDHYLFNSELTSITWHIANKQYIELYKLLESFEMDEEDIYQLANFKRLMHTY